MHFFILKLVGVVWDVGHCTELMAYLLFWTVFRFKTFGIESARMFFRKQHVCKVTRGTGSFSFFCSPSVCTLPQTVYSFILFVFSFFSLSPTLPLFCRSLSLSSPPEVCLSTDGEREAEVK